MAAIARNNHCLLLVGTASASPKPKLFPGVDLYQCLLQLKGFAHTNSRGAVKPHAQATLLLSPPIATPFASEAITGGVHMLQLQLYPLMLITLLRAQLVWMSQIFKMNLWFAHVGHKMILIAISPFNLINYVDIYFPACNPYMTQRSPFVLEWITIKKWLVVVLGCQKY